VAVAADTPFDEPALYEVIYGSSAPAPIVCDPDLPAPGCPDPNVTTQHNDNARTGAYLHEAVLTPDAVRMRGMRVKYWLGLWPCDVLASGETGCIQGALDTQPLYVKGVVFLATLENWVYGVDANEGKILWRRQLVARDGWPQKPRGVHATPVIDVAHNRMYVLFSTKDRDLEQPSCKELYNEKREIRVKARKQSDDLRVAYWLAMLDIRTGHLLQDPVPVTAKAKRRDGTYVDFVPKNQLDHAGLLLDHGSVYIAFGSVAHAECLDYHGWVMRYDASTLAQQAVFNTSVEQKPEQTERYGGSGIWQGGGGLAADADGNVYFTTGNGLAASTLIDLTPPKLCEAAARPPPVRRSAPSTRPYYGDAILKLRAAGTTFDVTPFFPDEAALLQDCDGDLGSGGTLVIPGSNRVMGGGKSGYAYLLNRANMQRVQTVTATENQYEPSKRGETWDEGPHLHGALTYWRGSDPVYGSLYTWGEKDHLRQHRFNTLTQEFHGQAAEVPNILALKGIMPGGMISLSAKGNSPHSGIIWAILPVTPGEPPHRGALYAFDAETLKFLWNTEFGIVARWVPPTIAGGRVFLVAGYRDPIFIAYDLGNPDGSDKSGPDPITPRPPDACYSCHNSGRMLNVLLEPMPMSRHYETGGAMQALPGLRLAALTPPEGLAKTVELEGNGMQIYEAEPKPGSPDELIWVPKDDTADLAEIPSIGALEEGRAPIKAQLSNNGSTWLGSDGSVEVGAIERTAPAPKDIDKDWLLYRVIESKGRGFLNGHSHIQRVFTHAGGPPSAEPKYPGEIARVPYYAQYWFYSAVTRESRPASETKP
jgi:outer membrane protein assembly factor BamB